MALRMAKADSRPTLVHPAATSRIAKASLELMGPLPGDEAIPDDTILAALDSAIARFGVRPLIKALESRKTELMSRLVTMVQREGEADPEGKVRYETEQHRFAVIESEHVYIGERPLRVAMTAAGVTPKIQQIILGNGQVRKVTPYAYVGVYRKAQATTPPPDEDGGA